MKHLFYFLTIIAITYEFCVISNLKKYLALKKKFKKPNIDFKKLPSHIQSLAVLQLLYALWTFVGLMTFNFPFFLLFILISIIPFKRNSFLLCLDATMSIIILIFILLNAYHFKINLYELIIK